MGVGPSEVVTPADLEQRIAFYTDQINQGVAIISEREGEAKRLQRELDREFARQYLAADGPQTEKRYRAELETAQLRADAEVAQLAFRHAERQMRSLETQLSAWQTIAKSLLASMGPATGRGR